MNFDFSRVYITGGTGWLGRQLCKTLTQGDKQVLGNFQPGEYQIQALVLPGETKLVEKESIFSGVNFVEGDVRKSESVEKLFENHTGNGLLVHIAGIIHPNKVKDFYDINVEGTRNVVEAAQKAGISKYVIISSNSPIGCNKDNQSLFNEQAAYNPYMGYGKSKMKMELYLKEKIDKDNLDITIIRPPWFYGENQPERQLTFYQMIKDGKFPFVGDGNNLRSKANVKNICQGILLAATNPKSKGEIYWIADKKAYSMKEIVETVGNVLKNEFNMTVKPNKMHVPHMIGQFAQAADYMLQSIGLYQQKIHVLSELNKNIACDISKAERELGYNPKVDLYNGVKEALLKNDDYKKLT